MDVKSNDILREISIGHDFEEAYAALTDSGKMLTPFVALAELSGLHALDVPRLAMHWRNDWTHAQMLYLYAGMFIQDPGLMYLVDRWEREIAPEQIESGRAVAKKFAVNLNNNLERALREHFSEKGRNPNPSE